MMFVGYRGRLLESETQCECVCDISNLQETEMKLYGTVGKNIRTCSDVIVRHVHLFLWSFGLGGRGFCRGRGQLGGLGGGSRCKQTNQSQSENSVVAAATKRYFSCRLFSANLVKKLIRVYWCFALSRLY